MNTIETKTASFSNTWNCPFSLPEIKKQQKEMNNFTEIKHKCSEQQTILANQVANEKKVSSAHNMHCYQLKAYNAKFNVYPMQFEILMMKMKTLQH